MSLGRDSVGVALLGDSLFAVGGYDGQSYWKTVEKYDEEKNEWIQKAPMNSCRAAACVVAVPDLSLNPSLTMPTV